MRLEIADQFYLYHFKDVGVGPSGQILILDLLFAGSRNF